MCDMTLPCGLGLGLGRVAAPEEVAFLWLQGLAGLKCPGVDAGRLGLRGEDSHSQGAGAGAYWWTPAWEGGARHLEL